jgi:hypothetical protein
VPVERDVVEGFPVYEEVACGDVGELRVVSLCVVRRGGLMMETYNDPFGFYDIHRGCSLERDSPSCLGDASSEFQVIAIRAGACSEPLGIFK